MFNNKYVQPKDIDKLRSLISSSAILSPSEKAEWLALLELMNDKQLGELEKILATAQKPAPAALPVQPQDSKSTPAVKRMPQLSHIVNIPQHVGRIPTAPAKGTPLAAAVNLPATPQVSSQTTAAKKTFSDKLKAMFAEKELSAPKAENLLPKGEPEARPIFQEIKKSEPAIAKPSVPKIPVPPAPAAKIIPPAVKQQPQAVPVKPVLPVIKPQVR